MVKIWRKDTFYVYCETESEYGQLRNLTERLHLKAEDWIIRALWPPFVTKLFQLETGRRSLDAVPSITTAAARASGIGNRFYSVPELRKKTLEYYRKHHARMDAFCEKRKRILLFDLHSYRDVIVPRELLPADGGTPDLCIGADPVYTPERLVEIVRNRFSAAGLTVAVNSPYSGTFVPGAVLRGESDCDCVSIMLEFHKRTYCDETWTPIPERQEFLKDVMKTVIADCVDLK